MEVKHIIFDLDNTLYPASAEMHKGITVRMMGCVADFFKTTIDEAIEIRAKKIGNFSTTLEWLRSEGFEDVEGYFAKVHPENEADELEKDAKLRDLLLSIEQPKVILTNAPFEHAQRVLNKLNVIDLFCGICDIRSSNLLGKPYPQAFENALKKLGGKISDTIFIDDMIKYTDGYRMLGGTALLVGDKNGSSLSPNAEAIRQYTQNKKGNLIKIDSIYQLPDILKN